MFLTLYADGGERQEQSTKDNPADEKPNHLTEADLDRIKSVAETPRFRRTPDMLCPDPCPDDEKDA